MAVVTVDEYLDELPAEVRERMEPVRALVHRVVPGAGERISYAMPTFTPDGRPLPTELLEQVVTALGARARARLTTLHRVVGGSGGVV